MKPVRERNMRLRRTILVVVAIVGGCLPAAAQNTFVRLTTIATKPARTSEPSDRRYSLHATFGSPVRPASERNSLGALASPVASTYIDERTPVILPRFEEIRTLFMSQSRLPVMNFAGGHVRLAGFGSTLAMGNVELGPSGAGGLLDFHPWRHYQPGDPRSFGSYGVSLGFHVGRDSQAGQTREIWRYVTRFLEDVR
ncbi:MAG: hypothetical protein WA734_12595 [Candidatus Acidiferrales bacterium]